MKILGIDLAGSEGESGESTLVLLDDDGLVARSERIRGLPGVAAAVGRLVGEGPFLLGVDVPVVVPAKPSRGRPVETLVRRRFGMRLPPGGRASETTSAPGEALMAGLATAGLPCLPYPDRGRRQSGLAETRPALDLKALLWESSALSTSHDPLQQQELFRACAVPPYRRAAMPARAGWAEQAMAIELILRALGPVEGYDLQPVRDALARAGSDRAVATAASLLDSVVIAGTVRRYLANPEGCLFLGEQESGYLILPADGLIRRLARTETGPRPGALFPQVSLRQRLGKNARMRPVDLLSVPGQPQRLEATFTEEPRYEFDNRDEMLWWKHCRHLTGPELPVEGLEELVVALDSAARDGTPLHLVRSRHVVLSFRFDPPTAWRDHVPPRDGRTYAFHVLRAVYDTLPAQD